MNNLTIYPGKAPANALFDAKIQGAQIHFLAPDFDAYTAFIRRTMVLRKIAATPSVDGSGQPTKAVIVDRHDLPMGPIYSRMLTRICAGVGADLRGPWCGVAPESFPENFGPGCGNWQGRVLILSWARGSLADRDDFQQNWPFISSCETGMAAWLGTQLDAAGIPERDLYWMNVCTYRGGVQYDVPAEAILGRVWDTVVTLGPDALIWANKNGLHVDHAAWHPNFWWREQGGKTWPAMEFIREVLGC